MPRFSKNGTPKKLNARPLLQLYADWWPASPGAAREEGGVSGLLVYTQKEFFNIRAGSESCRAAAKVLPSEKMEGGGSKKDAKN